jgi:hypothetical protein
MACNWSTNALSALATLAERTLLAATSCHAPTRVKMCEGMCSACGAEGAISA